MPTSITRRVTVAALTLLAASTTLSACGSDSLDPVASGSASTGASGTDVTAAAKTALDKVTKDDALAAKVPAKIASAGVIKVGSDASYAPNEFTDTDGTTIVGMDVDLYTAVAKKLGLKATFSDSQFDSIILNVTSGKYDVGASSFTINAERMKQVHMVKYFNAGTQWAVQKGNPKKVDADDACGLTVGVQKGTVQVDDLVARSKKCTDAGKKPINSVVEVAQSKVTADLVSGKVDAMAADSPITNYAVQLQGDALEKLGSMYDSAPYGFVVPKSETDFASAISGALEALKKDGTYDAVLAKWGNKDGAVTDFTVDPAAS